jgi:hypothetical protein
MSMDRCRTERRTKLAAGVGISWGPTPYGLCGQQFATAFAATTLSPDDKPTYRGAAVYRNESQDGGRSFGPDINVADHACECCRIALSPLPGGGGLARTKATNDLPRLFKRGDAMYAVWRYAHGIELLPLGAAA